MERSRETRTSTCADHERSAAQNSARCSRAAGLAATLASAAQRSPARRCERARSSLSVKDEGHLRLRQELRLDAYDEGPAHGVCRERSRSVRLQRQPDRQRPDHDLRALRQRSRRTAAGACRARAARAPSFKGTLTITGGTGRYAHAHGSGAFYGVFYRRSYAITVQTEGTLTTEVATLAAVAIRRRARARPGRAGEPRRRRGATATLSAAFTPLAARARPPPCRFAVSIDPPPVSGPLPTQRDRSQLPTRPGARHQRPRASKPATPRALATQGTERVPAGLEDGRRAARWWRCRSGQGSSTRPCISTSMRHPPATATCTSRSSRTAASPSSRRSCWPAVLLPGPPADHGPPDREPARARPTRRWSACGRASAAPLTYYERVHGRTVAYRPQGIGLPDSCPRGGWKLAARFTFIDGSASRARTAVRCPARH